MATWKGHWGWGTFVTITNSCVRGKPPSQVTVTSLSNQETCHCLKCVDLLTDGELWNKEGFCRSWDHLLISWDRTGPKGERLVNKRRYSSDAPASLNDEADREVSQPHSLVREGSLRQVTTCLVGRASQVHRRGICNQCPQQKSWGELGVKNGGGEGL